MMRTGIITIWMFVVCSLSAQHSSYSRAKVWLNQAPISQLAELGIEVDHGEHKTGYYFISDLSEAEINRVQQAGFQVEVLIPNVTEYYANQPANTANKQSGGGCNNAYSYHTPNAFALGSMGGYFTYQEMLDNLDSMAARYPNLITARQAISSTTSHEGRPIYWIKVSDNPNTDENEPEALYTALHHAREPGSLSQMIFYLWYILENYNTNTEIQALLDNTELYFIPCINPDGYLFNEANNPNGGGLWRKNRRNNGGGEYGVDLNRNYGYEWGFNNSGSSPNPASDTYRGPSGFSEPETQNVRDFCNAHDFQIALNYHTFGNLLIYPWGFNDQLTPDSNSFRGMADYLTKENNYFAGTGSETVGYTTNGDSDDWMYGEDNTKNPIFSFTPEAGQQSSGFWPSSGEIIGICNDNMHQNLAVPRMLLNYGEAEDASPTVLQSTGGHLLFDLTRFGQLGDPLTVSIIPITSNITTVGNAQVFNLQRFESVLDSISYTLDSSVADGDAVSYVIAVNNGLYVSTDTVVKTYGTPIPLYTTDASATTGWNSQGNGNWGTTNTQFISSPSSFTDSPNGNYGDNENSSFGWVNTVRIPDSVESAVIRFYAKWDIEAGYDYVQFEATTPSAFTWTPLCGKYTKQGNNNQDPNQPLYDGIQSDWVLEEVDVSSFIGEEVYLRFQLVSDQFVNGDGFYFDELELFTIGVGDTTTVNDTSDTTSTTGLVQLASETQLLVYPNPATDQVIIDMAAPINAGELIIYDAAGKQVYREVLGKSGLPRHYINTSDWMPGVFYYQLLTPTKAWPVGRLVILD